MLAAETRHVSGRSRLLHSATALGRRKGWAGGDVRCQSARIAASATVGSEWCGRSRPKLCSAPARLLSSIEVGLCGRFGRPCVEHAQSGRAARCEIASTHRPWRRATLRALTPHRSCMESRKPSSRDCPPRSGGGAPPPPPPKMALIISIATSAPLPGCAHRAPTLSLLGKETLSHICKLDHGRDRLCRRTKTYRV